MKKSIQKTNSSCKTLINIPAEMDEQYRELAKKRGLAKSHMILFAMSWYLDYNKTYDTLPSLIEAIKASKKDF